MAKPKKKGGPKQKLSPAAAARKAKRDTRRANRADRKAKRADSQKKRRAAKKLKKNIKGKDYDHRTKRFTKIKFNRGAGGNGTKTENTRKA